MQDNAQSHTTNISMTTQEEILISYRHFRRKKMYCYAGQETVPHN
jgi:hypothetical protein